MRRSPALSSCRPNLPGQLSTRFENPARNPAFGQVFKLATARSFQTKAHIHVAPPGQLNGPPVLLNIPLGKSATRSTNHRLRGENEIWLRFAASDNSTLLNSSPEDTSSGELFSQSPAPGVAGDDVHQLLSFERFVKDGVGACLLDDARELRIRAHPGRHNHDRHIPKSFVTP